MVLNWSEEISISKGRGSHLGILGVRMHPVRRIVERRYFVFII